MGKHMGTLKRENLSDKLVDIISRQIIHNELKSGDAVNETQISKEWGISRSPVRDALHTLEQLRLVERSANGRYQISDFSVDSILHYYDTANILFQYAFSKAAENATGNDLRTLSRATEKIEKSAQEKDFDVYLEGVMEFAQVILRTSGNPVVEKITLELMPTAQRLQWLSITHSPDRLNVLAGHVRRSLDNILAKNSQAAAVDFARFALIHKENAIECVEAWEKRP